MTIKQILKDKWPEILGAAIGKIGEIALSAYLISLLLHKWGH